MNKFSFCNFVIALLLIFTASSCQKGNEIITSPEGVRYIHHVKNPDGKKPDADGYWEVHFALYAETPNGVKDSLINSTYKTGQMVPAKVKDATFKDVFSLVSLGDSITVFIPADSLQGQNFAKPGTDVRYVIKFVNAMTAAEFEAKVNQQREAQVAMMLQQRQQMSDAARATQLAKDEDAAIQKYIKDKKLNAQKHESGMYYVIENAGEKVDIKSMDMVAVHYKGYLLDGSVFDSSYERNQPLTIPIMAAQVIEGWDVGIPLFGKGGKGKLIIPSYMGYGERGAGEKIPANSILLFDVELLQVVKQ
jgi:FKBP-type peptidyl-prolyl cis-trans isomerase